MKKLNWLDKFAEEQAQKLNKVASTTKVAEQVIVSPEDVPNAQDGSTIEFNGEQFTVVNANFSDEMGPGVVLEKAAAYEGLEQDPMGLSMGTSPANIATPTQGQEYHYTKLETEQTFDNDQDAAWGQSSAQATEQMIAGENAVDRTTVPGHYTNSPGLNNAAPVAPVATEVPAPTDVVETTEDVAVPEAPVAEEVTVEETPVEETPTEETPTEEVTPEEVPAEEAPVEEDKKLASNRILNRIYQKGNK